MTTVEWLKPRWGDHAYDMSSRLSTSLDITSGGPGQARDQIIAALHTHPWNLWNGTPAAVTNEGFYWLESLRNHIQQLEEHRATTAKNIHVWEPASLDMIWLPKSEAYLIESRAEARFGGMLTATTADTLVVKLDTLSRSLQAVKETAAVQQERTMKVLAEIRNLLETIFRFHVMDLLVPLNRVPEVLNSSNQYQIRVRQASHAPIYHRELESDPLRIIEHVVTRTKASERSLQRMLNDPATAEKVIQVLLRLVDHPSSLWIPLGSERRQRLGLIQSGPLRDMAFKAFQSLKPPHPKPPTFTYLEEAMRRHQAITQPTARPADGPGPRSPRAAISTAVIASVVALLQPETPVWLAAIPAWAQYIAVVTSLLAIGAITVRVNVVERLKGSFKALDKPVSNLILAASQPQHVKTRLDIMNRGLEAFSARQKAPSQKARFFKALSLAPNPKGIAEAIAAAFTGRSRSARSFRRHLREALGGEKDPSEVYAALGELLTHLRWDQIQSIVEAAETSGHRDLAQVAMQSQYEVDLQHVPHDSLDPIAYGQDYLADTYRSLEKVNQREFSALNEDLAQIFQDLAVISDRYAEIASMMSGEDMESEMEFRDYMAFALEVLELNLAAPGWPYLLWIVLARWTAELYESYAAYLEMFDMASKEDPEMYPASAAKPHWERAMILRLQVDQLRLHARQTLGLTPAKPRSLVKVRSIGLALGGLLVTAAAASADPVLAMLVQSEPRAWLAAFRDSHLAVQFVLGVLAIGGILGSVFYLFKKYLENRIRTLQEASQQIEDLQGEIQNLQTDLDGQTRELTIKEHWDKPSHPTIQAAVAATLLAIGFALSGIAGAIMSVVNDGHPDRAPKLIDLNGSDRKRLLRERFPKTLLSDGALKAIEKFGRFSSLDQLRQIPGIGESTMAILRPHLKPIAEKAQNAVRLLLSHHGSLWSDRQKEEEDVRSLVDWIDRELRRQVETIGKGVPVVVWLEFGGVESMPNTISDLQALTDDLLQEMPGATRPDWAEILAQEPMAEVYLARLRGVFDIFLKRAAESAGGLNHMSKSSSVYFDTLVMERIRALQREGYDIRIMTEIPQFEAWVNRLRDEAWRLKLMIKLLDGKYDQAFDSMKHAYQAWVALVVPRDNNLALRIVSIQKRDPELVQFVIRGTSHRSSLSGALERHGIEAVPILRPGENPASISAAYALSGIPSLDSPLGLDFLLRDLLFHVWFVTLFKPQEEVDPIRHQRLVDASIALPGALITAWWHMFRASEPSGDLSTTSLRTREWLAEKVKDTDESVRAVVAAAEQDAYLPLRSPRWTLSGLWRNLKRHNLPILSIAILAGAPHVVGLIFIGLGAYAASFIWKQHLPYRNRMASAA